MDRRSISVGLLLGVVVGAVVGWWVAPAPAPTAPGSESAQARPRASAEEAERVAELEALRAELRDERTRRLALEERLASAAPPAEAPDTDERSDDSTTPKPAAPSREPGEYWLDDDLLSQAGFAESEVAALRELFAEIELERLYLRDQATREGWIGRPRYGREVRELDARYKELRDEYGDDAYDWILHASGRFNRVVVKRVIANSEAEIAGLAPGDVVLRYEGRRIFAPSDLRDATTDGQPGRTVSLDLVRDGEPRRVYLPRGPLGIGLRRENTQPEPLR